MKAKYILLSLIASLAALVGCQKETAPFAVEMSQSYVGLPQNGGSVAVDVTTTGSWTIEEIPAWLTVSPASGSTGTTKVTFSADACTSTNEAELRLVCGSAVQYINVIQMAEKVEAPVSTVAEINAGADSKIYRAKGTVTRIVQTVYGNWYLQDETGELYIYGTLDAQGNTQNFTSLGLEVGDIVTVEGPKTTYNGTVELVDVTVISIEKSLIKVETAGPVELEKEGGEFEVELTCKGNGVSVVIPESAKSWISVTGISNAGTSAVVSFSAAANEGGARSETLVFTTNGGAYTAEISLNQKGSIVEVSVAEFLAAEVGTAMYRLTGVITGGYSSDNQGQSFYLKDWSGETLVYRLDDFKASGAKIGDIITVVGQRGAYKDSPQMVSGVYEKHISVTEVSVEEFLSMPDDKNVYYMVTGTIKEIDNPTYGNLYMTDGDNDIYVYGCYPGYGATGDDRKNFLETAGIKVGDELTMIGYKDTYNGKIELCGGTYFSHKSAE